MKLKKIVTYVFAPIPTLLTVFAMAYFIYYISGLRAAVVFAIIITAFLISIVGYSVYDIRIKHRGESMASRIDRQGAAVMKLANPRLLAIFLLPFIFLIFAHIYTTTLFLLFGFICSIIGNFCDQWPKITSLIICGVSIFFAIGTCVWLWKQMKSMLLGTTKDSTRLA